MVITIEKAAVKDCDFGKARMIQEDNYRLFSNSE